MGSMRKFLVSAALMAALVLPWPPAPAVGDSGDDSPASATHAQLASMDPQTGTLNHAEWADAWPPQRRVVIENGCDCTGTFDGFSDQHNGNTFREFVYDTPRGVAYIAYRTDDDGFKRVGWYKVWVPDDGDQEWVFF